MSSVPRRDDLEKPRVRNSDTRRRYIRRARSLLQYGHPFRRRVIEIRKAWDARWPAYAIGAPDEAPEPIPINRAGEVQPPALIERFPVERSDHLGPWYQAAPEWTAGVAHVCREFFPPRYYPDLGGASHPAAAFVGACIVYQVETFPIDLIGPEVFQPQSLHFDPTDPSQWPGRGKYEARIKVLEHHLAMALRDQPDVLVDIQREAAEAETESWREELLRQDPDWIRRLWYYVPLSAGMTATDWRALETRVLELIALRFANETTDHHIRALLSDGMPVAEVAELLGVSEDKVSASRSLI